MKNNIFKSLTIIFILSIIFYSAGAAVYAGAAILTTGAADSRLSTDSPHWADGAVANLIDSGVIAAGEFEKSIYDAPINRGDVSDILIRIIPRAEFVEASGDMIFVDVGIDSEYFTSSYKAYALSLILGYPDMTFRPEALIERQELFAIIGRALENGAFPVDYDDVVGAAGTVGATGADGAGYVFSDDGDIAEYAKSYCYLLANNSIIVGYNDGTLRPHENVSHAEALTIIEQIYSMLKISGTAGGDGGDGATAPGRVANDRRKPKGSATQSGDLTDNIYRFDASIKADVDSVLSLGDVAVIRVYNGAYANNKIDITDLDGKKVIIDALRELKLSAPTTNNYKGRSMPICMDIIYSDGTLKQLNLDDGDLYFEQKSYAVIWHPDGAIAINKIADVLMN